jgi:hypothetical protein
VSCGTGQFGYSCVGSYTFPSAEGSSLTCTFVKSQSGKSEYCCDAPATAATRPASAAARARPGSARAATCPRCRGAAREPSSGRTSRRIAARDRARIALEESLAWTTKAPTPHRQPTRPRAPPGA